MRKDLTIVIVNGPHFGISKRLFLTLILNFILNIFSNINNRMHWSCLLCAHSFCFGWTSFGQAKLNWRLNIFLGNTLTPNLRGFSIILCQSRLLLCFFFLLFVTITINVILAMLKLSLRLDIFFEVIKNLVLPELEPKHVNVRISRIKFLDCPPRSIISKNSLNKWAVVPLSNIQYIVW